MNWYEEDVRKAEEEKHKRGYQPKMIFYGSSSIRLWDTLYDDFAKYQPLNLGFGGSTLQACIHFFDRLLKDEQPEQLIIYAGDNDLGDGVHPSKIFDCFKELYQLITKNFPNAQTFYISVKPSVARWNINEEIKAYNQLVQDAISSDLQNISYIDVYNKMLDENGKPDTKLYVDDGLHLSNEGYILWKQILLNEFAEAIHINS